MLGSAVRAEPGELDWRVQYALALLQSGEIAAGCGAAGDALLYGPEDARALEVAARCELVRGNPAGALEHILEAREADPADDRLDRAEKALRVVLPDP